MDSSSNVSDSLPLTSPAFTSEIYKLEKTPGCLSSALDKIRPFLISSAIFKSIFLNFLFFSSVLKK